MSPTCEVCGRSLAVAGHLVTDPRPRIPGTSWGMTRCLLCEGEGRTRPPWKAPNWLKRLFPGLSP